MGVRSWLTVGKRNVGETRRKSWDFRVVAGHDVCAGSLVRVRVAGLNFSLGFVGMTGFNVGLDFMRVAGFDV